MLEEQLVKKAIKGNKKAFDRLIREYSRDGYRLAYYYLNHQADSQDALGTAIEKAYKKIHKLEKQEKFKSWFMTIVVNEAKMMLRKRSAANVIPLDAITSHAEEEKKNGEELLDLQDALGRLSEEDRSLLMMKHYEGYTFREISFMLNIPESTVKTRNYSLLEKLRKDLARRENGYVRHE